MRGIRKRMEKADLQRGKQEIAAQAAAAQQEQVNRVAAELMASATKLIGEGLRRNKVQNGKDADPDGVMVAGALSAFAQFLAANGAIVRGPKAAGLSQLAIGIISAAAVKAKAESEEKKIILLTDR